MTTLTINDIDSPGIYLPLSEVTLTLSPSDWDASINIENKNRKKIERRIVVGDINKLKFDLSPTEKRLVQLEVV